MRVVISAEGTGREGELDALHTWLRADSALRQGATVTAGGPQQSGGRMGIGSDEIQVAIAVAAFALELGNSLRSWLRSRANGSGRGAAQDSGPRIVVVVDSAEVRDLLGSIIGDGADVRYAAGPGGDDGPDDGPDDGSRDGSPADDGPDAPGTHDGPDPADSPDRPDAPDTRVGPRTHGAPDATAHGDPA